MKKKLSIGLLCFMCVLVSACSNTDKEGTGNSSELSTMKLETMMEGIYKGIGEDELPSLVNTPVTAENLKNYTGLESLDFEEGLASEPMIGSIAHSVVLLRVSDGVDIEKTKSDIKQNVDPRKWICVGVEDKDVLVDSRDNVIVLIMVNGIASDLQKNFKAL